MGQHTPGPWSYVPDKDICTGEQTGKFAILHNGPIAYTGNNGDGPDNAEANARLIAAAPELLAACEDAEAALVEYYDYAEKMREIGRGFYPVGKRGESIDYILCAVRAAIRTARGGRGPEERQAICRLIAAAPDLLSACMAGAEHFEGTDAPLGAKFRAAIRKAKGVEADTD